MKYHLISALLLVAAVVLETLGFSGGVVLLAAGVGCEMWCRIASIKMLLGPSRCLI